MPHCASVAEKLIPSSAPRPLRLEEFNQDQPHDKTPDMGKEGHVGDGPSHNSHELNEEPESQDEQSREADKFNEDEDEEQREHPGSGKKKEVGT